MLLITHRCYWLPTDATDYPQMMLWWTIDATQMNHRCSSNEPQKLYSSLSSQSLRYPFHLWNMYSPFNKLYAWIISQHISVLGGELSSCLTFTKVLEKRYLTAISRACWFPVVVICDPSMVLFVNSTYFYSDLNHFHCNVEWSKVISDNMINTII